MKSYITCSCTVIVKQCLICVLGSEPVAADAGQVSDHVRPDYLKEYPLCVVCGCV